MTQTPHPPPESVRVWSQVSQVLPGLMLCGVVAVFAFAAERVVKRSTPLVLSPLVIAVVIGVLLTNLRVVPAICRPGITFSARKLLRLGVVLLGLQLSTSEVRSLGPRGILLVLGVVAATFVGTQWLGRRMGLTPELSLLVATGFSICGASAVTAVRGVIDADDEDTAYAIALVTICGTLAIVTLPTVGSLIGFNGATFGSWVGASVHDVAQTVATAATEGPVAEKAAVIVKLTRVVLLAPLVAGVALWRRRAGNGSSADAGVHGAQAKSPPLLPLFVLGFIGAIVLRSTGEIPPSWLARSKDVEKLLFAAALVGLGISVDIAKLRRIGGRPLVLGLASWLLIAVLSGIGVEVLGLGR